MGEMALEGSVFVRALGRITAVLELLEVCKVL